MTTEKRERGKERRRGDDGVCVTGENKEREGRSEGEGVMECVCMCVCMCVCQGKMVNKVVRNGKKQRKKPSHNVSERELSFK